MMTLGVHVALCVALVMQLVGVSGPSAVSVDAANRLRKVTQGTDITQFTYDGEGNRLKLNYTGPDANYETDYLLDLSGGLSMTLREQQGSAQTWYLNGLDVIGQETASGWTYFGYDGLGSVRHLMDATGQLTYRADYDPYGVPVPIAVQPGASTTTLGFTGEQTDPTGLLYLRARYMNPQTGMFLSRDPVEGIFGYSASYNGYGYVEGDPINFVDPSGRCDWEPCKTTKQLLAHVLMAANDVIGWASPRAAAITDMLGKATGVYDLADSAMYFIDSTIYEAARLLGGHPKRPQYGVVSRVIPDLYGYKFDPVYQQVRRDIRLAEPLVGLAGALLGAKGAANFFNGGGMAFATAQTTWGTTQVAVSTARVGVSVTSGIAAVGGVAALRSFGSNTLMMSDTTGNDPQREYWDREVEFEGQKVYQRDDLIDPNRQDANGVSNLDRMRNGNPPIGPDGNEINLHHLLQTDDGPLAEMTRAFHRKYYGIIHINPRTIPSGILRTPFKKFRKLYFHSPGLKPSPSGE